jgi:hypothetical protein
VQANREGPSRIHRLGIAVDGAACASGPFEAVRPLAPDVISVDPWPGGSPAAEGLLCWLGHAFPRRPLLGLTPRVLPDPLGVPLRGLSSLGSGVALVSTRGLSERTLAGVVLHEVAHAMGLGHCERWDCALGERPYPLGAETRPASLCPRCQTLWESRCEGGIP